MPFAGSVECPNCRRMFEATVFQPVQRRHRNVETLAAMPDGVAGACANHARNAAVTSCKRCGLFICALCDMNVGEGSFCPGCFDRVRADGTLQSVVTRSRDYAGMARVALVFGLLMSFGFLGLPFGAVGLYYAIRGLKQRRTEGAPVTGMVIAIIVAVAEMLSTFGLIGLIVMASTQ
jgi:hypothetical protein